MALPPPKIDSRTYADLVVETEQLAQRFSQWQLSPNHENDAGRALIRIFGRMATMVADRLNRVPGKHFLAFLNLIGAQQQPPRPARVPLTAYLVDNSSVEALLPARTSIAAVLSNSDQEVLFETEQNLVVMRSQLQAVIVQQGDRWCDYFSTLTQADADFPVFTVAQPNTIYIAANQLITAPNSTEIQLAIANVDALNQLEEWHWSYWDGEVWRELTAEADADHDKLTLAVAATLAHGWQPPQVKQIEDTKAKWLRAIAPATDQLASLTTVRLVQSDTGAQPPEQAFFNTEAIDLSKDFLPLGKTPAFNDTLYIASARYLHLPNQQVTLHFEPSDGFTPRPSTNPAPAIAWETWNGQTWTPVLIPNTEQDLITSDWHTPTSLKLPSQVAPTQVNGEENYWLRARLIKGNYGNDIRLQSQEYTLEILESKPSSGPDFPSTGRGQVIVQKVAAEYYVCIFDWNGNRLAADHLDGTGKVKDTDDTSDTSALRTALAAAIATPPADQRALLQQLQTLLKVNLAPHLTFVSELEAGYFPPSLQSIQLQLGEVQLTPQKILKALSSGHFVFDRTESTNRSTEGVYLRFDRPFPHQAIALYLRIASPQPGELEDAQTVETPAKLQWQYSTADGWQPLTVQDGTQNLMRRGMVEFIGPADFIAQTHFGQSGYWLRLRWLEGNFAIPPRLQQVLTNTVWAIQATTYTDEILGNGTGDPHLILRSQQAPVLPGQRLVVREPELPPVDEQNEIKKLEGNDAVEIVTNSAGEPTEIWVYWHEVRDFYASSSRDRHYTLDRITGEIRFGGEGQGMAPPRGRNNIRLAHYQSGGGQQGNCAAETVTELKTTIPYVDRVTNHEPATGGADMEPIASVQQSAPKQLRHRDRAVTWQDIEDLTYAASSEIARVKVLTPKFDPVLLSWIEPDADPADALNGRLSSALAAAQTITVLIVPYGMGARPTPTLGLVEQVKRYLRDRTSPDLNLRITEPHWVEVTVTATVVATSLAATNGLQEMVQQVLTDFLHPLTGDTRKQGWLFGRHPHASDLYAVIERIPGVSHVTKLEPVPPPPAANIQDRFLIYSGHHQITINSP
jgi:hypothetical protein